MKEKIDYIIREVRKEDQEFLYDILYQAIFIEPGSEPVGREELEKPEIKIYAENWGKSTDYGYLAVDVKTKKKIGAAWLRLIGGYGYIADDVPEIGIAIYPEYRGKGIGKALLKFLLDATTDIYQTISLAVQTKNKVAIGLYKRLGFKECGKKGTETIMRFDRK